VEGIHPLGQDGEAIEERISEEVETLEKSLLPQTGRVKKPERRSGDYRRGKRHRIPHTAGFTIFGQ